MASFCENRNEFSGYTKAGLILTNSATTKLSIKNHEFFVFVFFLFCFRNDRHLTSQIKLVHSKPSGYSFWTFKKFPHSAHTAYLCVPYGSENKQRLFPYTVLTDCCGLKCFDQNLVGISEKLHSPIRVQQVSPKIW